MGTQPTAEDPRSSNRFSALDRDSDNRHQGQFVGRDVLGIRDREFATWPTLANPIWASPFLVNLLLLLLSAIPPDRPPPDRPNFRFFFSLSRSIFALFVSLWVFSR